MVVCVCCFRCLLVPTGYVCALLFSWLIVLCSLPLLDLYDLLLTLFYFVFVSSLAGLLCCFSGSISLFAFLILFLDLGFISLIV